MGKQIIDPFLVVSSRWTAAPHRNLGSAMFSHYELDSDFFYPKYFTQWRKCLRVAVARRRRQSDIIVCTTVLRDRPQYEPRPSVRPSVRLEFDNVWLLGAPLTEDRLTKARRHRCLLRDRLPRWELCNNIIDQHYLRHDNASVYAAPFFGSFSYSSIRRH